MPGLVLTGSSTTGIYLNNSATQNPAIFTNTASYTVQIGSVAKGKYVYPWTVTNYGIIQASNNDLNSTSTAKFHVAERLAVAPLAFHLATPSYGIDLAGGGTVINAGYISAVDGSAVLIDSDAG